MSEALAIVAVAVFFAVFAVLSRRRGAGDCHSQSCGTQEGCGGCEHAPPAPNARESTDARA